MPPAVWAPLGAPRTRARRQPQVAIKLIGMWIVTLRRMTKGDTVLNVARLLSSPQVNPGRKTVPHT